MRYSTINITRNNGQALIEFMFVFIILVTVLSAAVNYCFMGIIKHNLDSACREGARVAATLPTLKGDNAIVISRINTVLMDSGLMRKSSIDYPLPQALMSFSSGSNVAVTNDIITVEQSVIFNIMFFPIFSPTKVIKGKAVSRYLL